MDRVQLGFLVRSPPNNDPPVDSRTGRYTFRAVSLIQPLRKRRRRVSRPRGEGNNDRRSPPPPNTQFSPSSSVACNSSQTTARVDVESRLGLRRQFELVNTKIHNTIRKRSGNQQKRGVGDIHRWLRTPLWESDALRPVCI